MCKTVSHFIFQPRGSDALQFEIKRICGKNTCLFSVPVLRTEYKFELGLCHIRHVVLVDGKIYLGHRHKNIEVQKNTDINSLETRPKSSSTCLNLSVFNLTQLLVLLTQEHLPHLPHNCSGNSCVSNCNTWLKQKRSCLRIWPESLKNAVCTVLTISEERFHQKLHIKHSSGFKANIFTRLDSLTNRILGLDARTYLPRTAGLSLKDLPAATTPLCVLSVTT